MGRKKDRTAGAQIQQLLDERRRIEQWLVRLDKAADRTPDAVRNRVRGDYESRLTAVVRELQSYEDDLRRSLGDVQARQAAARKEEKLASEELAEAELRYAVGEFGDAEWSEKKTGILDRLIGIRESLGQAEEEIAELDEVLASIAASPEATHEEEEAEEPEIAELDDVDEGQMEEPAARAAPRAPPGRATLGSELGLRDLPGGAQPASPKSAAKPQTEVFGDELAFLKALSDEGGTAPPPPPRPAAPKPAAAAPKVEPVSDQPPLARSRPSVINQRTLKCGECGAMNLPTEWYCDRCGAELASL